MKKLNYCLLLVLLGIFGNSMVMCMEIDSDDESEPISEAKRVALEALERGEDPFTSPRFQTLLQLQRAQAQRGEIETPTDVLGDIHEYSKSLLPVTEEIKTWLARKKNALSGFVDSVSISPQGDFMVVVSSSSNLRPMSMYRIKDGNIEKDGEISLAYFDYKRPELYMSPLINFVVEKADNNKLNVYWIKEGEVERNEGVILNQNVIRIYISPQGNFVVAQKEKQDGDTSADIYRINQRKFEKFQEDALGGGIKQIYMQKNFIAVKRWSDVVDIYRINNGVFEKDNEINLAFGAADEVNTLGDFIIVKKSCRRGVCKSADIYRITEEGVEKNDKVDLGKNIVGIKISSLGGFMLVWRNDNALNTYRINDGVIEKNNEYFSDGKISDIEISPREDFIVVKRENATADIYRIKNRVIEWDDEGFLGEDIMDIEISPREDFVVVKRKNDTVDIYFVNDISKQLQRTSQAGLELIVDMYAMRDELQDISTLQELLQKIAEKNGNKLELQEYIQVFNALPKILQDRLLVNLGITKRQVQEFVEEEDSLELS